MVSGLLRSGAPYLGLAAVALALGCTPTTAATAPAGLMVVVSAGLSPYEYDQIRVRVSQTEGVDSGSWHTWLDETKAVPSEVVLPTAFLVRPGSSPDQTALIQVTALLSGQPVVLREAQVSVPTDRLAELDLLLSEACKNQVTIDTTTGQPASTCPQGQSCQPPTGLCGTDVIEASTLPLYPSSGETGEADATTDGDSASSADALTDVSLDAASPDAPEIADAAGGPAVALACGDAGACIVGGVLSVGREPESATLPDGTSVSVSNQRIEPVAAACDPTGWACVSGGALP